MPAGDKQGAAAAGTEEASPMRGYKMVNGKKTSYFHTELSAEAKALLAKDAGPKRVSKEEAAALEQAAAKERRSADKWDNDEFIEQAMAEAERDDGGAAKSAAAKRKASASGKAAPGGLVEVLRAVFIRVLPALIMGVMAVFRPPTSDMGWAVFVAIAVAASAANKPQNDVAGDRD